MNSFTETVEAAKTLRKTFNNLVESVVLMISQLNVHILKFRINTYIRDEQQNTREVRRDLDDLQHARTAGAVLNFLINRNFLGYLNYELLKVFEDIISSDELTSKIQKYKTEHDRFLQYTDFRTLIEVFKENPELAPASAVGLPKFTLHLESEWEGRSTYSWKELLNKQFNWPPHVHVTSITRNCIIIEYSVLPFFASAVVRDLTDPLVLAVLKRQGVTVKLSLELIEKGKEMIIPRNDEEYTSLHLAAKTDKTDTVEVLIKHGADVHEKTTGEEYTSLHLAAKSDKTDTVEALIKHGADVHEKTTGETKDQIHCETLRGMATPVGDGGEPNKVNTCYSTGLHFSSKLVMSQKTPYQGKEHVFAKFRCQKCNRTWSSSNSWANMGQLCKVCNIVVYPYEQETKYLIHCETLRGIAIPVGDGREPKKRFNAKYNCKWCKETWKTKNTSHLKMICKKRDCRKTVRAYEFEVIDKLVVYKCESCDSLLKKAKCSSEVKDVPLCSICHKDMVVHLSKNLWKKSACLESSSVMTATMNGRVGLPGMELDRDAATAML